MLHHTGSGVLHSLYSTSNVHSAELPFPYSMAYFSVHSFAILLYLIEHGVLEKDVYSLLLYLRMTVVLIVLQPFILK